MAVEMNPIDSTDPAVPKDGTTIIVTGGWYEYQGERIVNAPSLAAWQDGKWVMVDDHKAEYHNPSYWLGIP